MTTTSPRAVAAAVERFGGIDVVINNASAIDLSRTDDVDMKRYDLMQDINVRGTFLLSKLALPALRKSGNGHILTLSPPLNLDPKWAGQAPGLHHGQVRHEPDHPGPGRGAQGGRHQRQLPLAVHPDRHRGHPEHARRASHGAGRPRPADHGRCRPRHADRRPTWLPARAAPPGNFYTDEQVLAAAGVTDFRPYSLGAAEDQLVPDIFL